MELFTKGDGRTLLQKEIDRLTTELGEFSPNEDDYVWRLELIERLMKVKDDKSKTRISPDAKATIAANLLGIGLILSYEKMNVISTKALNFVIRGRV